MRFRAVGVTHMLFGLGESVLCRGMERIKLDRPFERRDRFRVFLRLRGEIPQKVLGTRVVRIDCRHLFKILASGVGVPQSLFEQAEAVPGAYALRVSFDRLGKHLSSVVVPAHVQQSDSHIQAARVGIRVHHAPRLKSAQRAGKIAPVH